MTDTTAKTDISSTAERATTVTTAGSVADLPGWEAVLHTITSRQRRRFRQLLALVGTAGIVLAATTAIVVDRAQRSSDRAAQDNGAGRLGPEPTAPAEESNEPASTTTSLVPVTTLAPTEGGIENQIFAQQQYEPLFVEHIGRYTLRFFSAGDQMFAGMFPGPFGMPGVPVEKGNGPVEPVQPAADCFPRQLAIQISDEQLATQVHLSVGGDPRYAMMTGGMSTLLQPIGIAERAPAWVAVVPVLPTQRAAKIAFPNGVVVDATVRDGLAIAILSDDSLDWRSMNSAPSTKIDLGEGLTRPRAPRIAARDECRPPPGMFGPAIELPAPGEQPRDVLAATAAIEDLVIRFTDGSRTKEERMTDVHEPGDLAQLLDTLASMFGPGIGPFGGGFGVPEPVMASVVFTSPTEAAAEVILMGGSARVDFVLVADRWMLTRPGACEILNRMSPGCNFQVPPDAMLGPPPLIEQ